MAEQKAPQMQATLGLTGLTSNAMALIAPGAFLWLTFAIQANTGVAGQPSTAPPCGSASSPLCCSAWPPQLPTLKSPSSIRAPAPATTTLSRPCSHTSRLQVCPHRQVHRRLGLAPLLLGLSRRDGRHHRHLLRLYRRLPLSKHHERLQPRTSLHGAGRGRLLLLRRMDRLQGRRRFHRRQPRHQRHSDLGAGRLQRSRPRLSLQPPGRARPPSSTTRSRSPPTPISSRPPRTAPPCATPAALRCPCWIPPASRFPSPSTTPKETPPATS